MTSDQRSPTQRDVTSQVRDFYECEGWVEDNGGTYVDTQRWGAPYTCYRDYYTMTWQKFCPYFQSGKKLFLNCGSGPLTESAQAYMGTFTTGLCVDISIRALSICQKKLGRRGFYLCSSITQLGLANDISAATLCEHVLYHIDSAEQESAVREMIRVTRPGCPILIIYSNPHAPLNIIENVLRRLGITRLLGGDRLYFFRHPLQWWSRFSDTCNIEMFSYLPISARQARVLLPNEKMASWFFRLCKHLEARYPSVALRLWDYPAILLHKRAS